MILDKLFVCDLVRKQKNVFFKFRYTTYFTVWSANKNNKLYGIFAKMYTCILMLMWLPILLIGMYLYGKTRLSYVEYASWISDLLTVGIIMVSIVIHECSHAMAAIALGGKYTSVE